ncbi:type II toxin-antitoxin system YafQ family toxin [Bartonella jaculi]|uniref:Type II toxin-antitoxin system mRNA interferase toxin, RelE/StbE family n=1 Tax=Bartonella jaculi TaxID=686226 RepID=A0ABP9NAQ6_9HYPH
MLTPVRSVQFKRDVRKAEKRGKNMNKLRTLLSLLIEEKPLPKYYCDHPLKGAWAGCRDSHVEPDWLLIYRIERDKSHLVHTGTYTDLFQG